MISPERNINIVIADSSPEFMEGLDVLFSGEPQYKILRTFTCGLELLNSGNLAKANVILLDMGLNKKNGLEISRQINLKYPDLPLIALCMHHDKLYIREIIACGFKGFIYIPMVVDCLFDVIDKVLNNEFDFSKHL